MRDAVLERAHRAIEERVFPGCAIGILAGGSAEFLCAGRRAYERESPLVSPSTVYDVASITKSIPTASLALNFLKRGVFDLADPVIKHLPELRNDRGATIEDLLRYRVSGARMSLMAGMTDREIERTVLEQGFAARGSEGRYANLPAFVLGLLIERIARDDLADLAEGDLFMPLGMSDTTFFPNPTECAPTELEADKEICGIVHDESARAFALSHRAAGHAGLFSTCADLVRFLQCLLERRYPNIVEGAEQGLGWQVAAPYFMGSQASGRTFGKTGFTGGSVLVDSERRVALVVLSNRTFPHRPTDAVEPGNAINVFRRDVADIVLSRVH